MAAVVWTAEAERWLRKIHDYIAKDKPGAAFNVVQSIYRRAQILATYPKLGHLYTSRRAERYASSWGHYRIVYFQPHDDDVHILGVFHGAMQIDEYLR